MVRDGWGMRDEDDEEPRKVRCCPKAECQSSDIYERERQRVDKRYRCRDCDNEFDDPNIRPKLDVGSSGKGLARDLERMDADDL